jgi:hypothetical protein
MQSALKNRWVTKSYFTVGWPFEIDGLQGLKPRFLRPLNVAAEVATYKDCL